jgi:ABC-2 type transport system permease protein
VTRALHAEWTKLRTVPGTAPLLLLAVLVTVAMGAAAAAAPAAGEAVGDPTRLSLLGVRLGQVVVAVLGVVVIGAEYATGTVRATFAAVPSRMAVLAAKATVLAGVVVAAGVVAVLGSLTAGWLLLPEPVATAGTGAVWRAGIGSVLYLALVALLALGVTTAVRDSTAGIGVVLALLYLVPVLAQTTGDAEWRRHLEQVGPMPAGLAVQATTGLADLPIGPWAGLGVLAAWAGGAILVGALVLRVRDA